MEHEAMLYSFKLIREDCLADTMEMEGKPFSGREVAKALGYVRAMIDTLALILEIHLSEGQDGHVPAKVTDNGN